MARGPDNDQPPCVDYPLAGVARLTLRRPGAANRIEFDDLDILAQRLRETEQDPAMRVLVLAAEGRHFSAGFDLNALRRQCEGGGDSGETAFAALADALAASRLISLAVLNGPAIGGASDLALACDLRIGSDAASLMMPAARIGLPLYAGALRRYASSFGLVQAKRMVLTGRTVGAAELERLGLLHEIVAADELAGHAERLAAEFAALPSRPAASMKHALDAYAAGTADEAAIAADLHAAFDGPTILAQLEARRVSRSQGRAA